MTDETRREDPPPEKGGPGTESSDTGPDAPGESSGGSEVSRGGKIDPRRRPRRSGSGSRSGAVGSGAVGSGAVGWSDDRPAVLGAPVEPPREETGPAADETSAAETPTDGGPPAPTGSGDTSPTPRRRRRLLRRALIALGILAVLPLLFHTTVLAWLIPQVLPGILADLIGLPVSIDGASVGRGTGGTVVVELYGVRAGEWVRPREGPRNPDAIPVDALRVDRVRVEVAGWWALREGLGAVERVEIGSLDLELPPEGALAAEVEGPAPALGGLPDLTIIAPAELHEVPFPVTVSRLHVERGPVDVVGSLTSPPGERHAGIGLDLSLEKITGVTGVERARATWVPTGEGRGRFAITAEPLAISVHGTVTSDDHAWELWIPACSGPGTIGYLSAGLPRDPADPVELGFQLEVYSTAEALAALGELPDPAIPDFISLRFDLLGNGTVWEGSGDLITPDGTLDLVTEVEEVAVDGGGDEGATEQRLVFSASGADLPVGRIVEPLIADLRPVARGDIEAWLEWGGDAPVIGGSIDLVDGSVTVEGNTIAFDRWATLGSWSPGRTVEVEASVLDLGAGKLVVDGIIPTARGQQWDGEFHALELQLDQLAPVVDLTGIRGVRGTLGISGAITGALDDPAFDAEGTLRGGELAPAGWERIRAIDADLSWRGHELRLARLSARIGGGSVDGRGSLRIAHGAVESLDTTLVFDGVRLLRTPSLRARGSGELRLLGDLDSPRLEGTLMVSRGIFDQDIHPSLQGGGGTSLPFDLFRFTDGFLSRLEFDVALDLAGNFDVRNNRVEVTPFGKLRLEGTGYQPVLVGAITANEGKLILPRIVFDIAQVEVRFPEDDPFQPRVQFVGRATTRGIEIEAIASGSLFSPVVHFTSSPTYPEEDLILLVATGRLREQIAADDVGIIAATELARLYGPQVWGSVFGGSGNGGGILDRIEVGAKTSEDTGEVDGVTVELKLNDWISVLAEQDGEGESTADLRFYWWLP